MRRSLAAVGLLLFGIPLSCIAGEETKDLSILPCVPGEQEGCRCEDGRRGLRECAGNGSGFGACARCGSACTLHPDCGGCVDCFETCICQSEGDVEGCRETCLTAVSGSNGSGGSGGGSSVPCVVDECPSPSGQVAQFIAKCCTSTNQCGLSITAIGGDCVERDQPGTLNPQCEPYTLPTVGITLEGCCRPEGKCGVLDTFAGFGCTDPSAFGQTFTAGDCTP